MRKIYDCFNFFNELDILEIRLNILYEHVNYFVIVESSVTHSGESKPFYFDDNKERFSKFLDKIISYKIYDTPFDFVNLTETNNVELNNVFNYIKVQTNRFDRSYQQDYGRDFFQKESVRRALINCNDDDIVIISDADEIPNPSIFEKLTDIENTIYSLNQSTYYYYINILKQKDWYGSKIGLYKNVRKYSLNEIRGDISLTKMIDNGGWHFSFMGGKEMVKKKITSYSARDMVSEHILGNIENNMNNNNDPFFRGQLTQVEIDNTYPKYLLDNLDKYKNMIK